MNDENDIFSGQFHKKLLKRNKEAFKRLYEHYKLPLYHLVFAMVKDNEKTADIIQDTFIKVIKNIDQLEDIKRIKYWLFRIAVNLTLNLLKRDQRLSYAGDKITSIADKQVGARFPSDRTERNEELSSLIHVEVARLPLKQRVPFTLKYVEHLKESEIAEILEIPVGTVKSRLSTARNKIKDNLKEL